MVRVSLTAPIPEVMAINEKSQLSLKKKFDPLRNLELRKVKISEGN